MRKILLALLCVMTFALPSWAADYYVKSGSSGSGDSWNNAYGSVTDAVSAASNASSSNIFNIYVAAGEYTHTTTITLKAGVKLYGGYPDNLTGTDTSTRDIASNTTTLKYTSGSVVTCSASDATSKDTVIDGFTIRGGTGTLNNTTNIANGGGIYISSGASPLITNCTISGNSASYGGGIYNIGVNSSPIIMNCTITGNSATESGGGIYNSGGGSSTITNCTITGNSADYGGGFYNVGENSSPIIMNCTITGNSASRGGGILNNGNATITNCTISDNTATNSGAEIYKGSGTVTLINTIVKGTTYGKITSNDCLFSSALTNWTPVSKSVTVDGVKQVVFEPPSNALSKGTTGSNIPTTDQLGRTRKAKPDIGAYEMYVFYVKTSDNGGDDTNHDGTSWDVAFATVAKAVEQAGNAGGGNVYVAAGTYLQTATITLKAGVKLYGGFTGSETTISLDARTFAYATTLSRDANSSAGGNFSIITCSDTNATSNDTVIDGFTIRGGNGKGNTDLSGGGFFNDSGSPLIANCTFTGNSVNYTGGGFFNGSGSPTITNCTFTNNTANSTGGGFYNTNGSPLIINCTFTGNTSSTGGGFYTYSGNLTFTNCTFTGNTSSTGGGFANSSGSPTITNCTFTNNTATTTGPEIYNKSGTVTLYNTLVKGTANGTITGSNNLQPSALTDWTPVSQSVKVKGVMHTVFTPPSNAIGKASADKAPTYDQLGQTRKATPDMGALETFWEVKIYSGEVALSNGDYLASGIAGQNYDRTLTTSEKFATVSADNLPKGISIEGRENEIKVFGRPLESGDFTFTLKLTSTDASFSTNLNLKIARAVVTIAKTGISATSGRVLEASVASLDLAAAPNVFSRDYTWNATISPDDGLVFDGTNQTVKGTPQRASYTLTVSATAPATAGGTRSESRDVILTFNGVAVSVNANLSTTNGGTAGVPYSGTLNLSATPENYEYTWDVTGYPSTLSYSGGNLTGTPLEAGSYTLTAKATAPALVGGTSGTRDVTLTIAPAVLSVAYTDDVKISNIGSPYTGIFTATPAVLAYTWEVDGLPNGLSHSASDNVLTINGTPTTAGDYTVTVKATGGGTTKEEIFTLKVSGGFFDDEENFPDENLREKLKDIVSMTEDFFITEEAVSGLTTLDVSGAGISDLSGLEKFTALTSLNVSGNNLNNPDFAKLPNLTYLDVHNCGLSTLDVSALTALEYLDCSVNYLRELDLSANDALNYFDGTAQILNDTLTGLQVGNLYLFDFAALLEKPENIDSVTGASRFEDFIATFTPEQPSAITYKYDAGNSAGLLEVSLSSVNFTTATIEITNAAISNNVGKVGEEFSSELISSATPEAIIFEWLVDGLPKGLSFDVDEKIISGIPNESGDFALEIIASAGGMFDNRTVMLTIEPADVEPVSPDIEPTSPDIEPTSSDLAVITAEDFSSLGKVGENYSATFTATPEEIYSWSVEGLPDGLEYFGIENTLTISGEPAEAGIFALVITAQNEEHSGTLRVSVIISPADKPDDNPDEPGGDDNPGNPSNPDTPDNPDTPADDSGQKIINVITEILTTGDVSTIEEIDTIDLSSMDITDLSVVVENLTGLESLDCSGNDIETIKLTVSKNLRYLNCSNNNTKTLDVSNSPLLVVLDCSENDLDELNVENNPDLVSLNCADNNLENLNLQNNSRLTLLGCWNNNFAALDLSAFNELYGLFEASAENRRDFNASDCANQKVHGLRIENTGGRYRVNLGSYVRRGRGGALSASDEGGSVSNIVATSVRGLDEAGNAIPIESYDEATGEIIFAQKPASVAYDYDTGYKGVKMDVTISGAEEFIDDPDEPVETNSNIGSKGGGCDAGFEVFALLALAVLTMSKK